MITQYYLQRIVKTDNPLVYRYIWEDLERQYPADWEGFFRGCEGTATTERWSHPGDDVEFPYSPWTEVEPVVALWERNGLTVEDVDPEWLAAKMISDAADRLAAEAEQGDDEEE